MSYNEFTKDNLDTYLRELAKEFRKLNGKAASAEIVLVGGAAILINYGFREATTDIDAIIHASSAMKDAINKVGDKFELPVDWLNADFIKTASYSNKLDEFSVYYKTFYGILNVRTVTAEYLIAMKLRSGRKYKNDLSDIIGILGEHEKRSIPISLGDIDKAVCNLYGGWDVMPEESKFFIENALKNGDFNSVYISVRNEELESKEILIDFEHSYPKVANSANINEILRNLKAKRDVKENSEQNP